MLNMEFVLAANLIMVAAILDGLDGALARLLNTETAFGARLDGYVDTVSFGVAPALLLYTSAWKAQPWGEIAATSIVAAAVLRFTRGCDLDSSSGRHCFRGLPIPVTAGWISLSVLMRDGNLFPFLSSPEASAKAVAIMWLCTAVFVFLEISEVAYGKPRREKFVIALGIPLLLTLIFGYPSSIVCSAMCLELLLYICLGPYFEKKIEGSIRKPGADDQV